MKTRTLRLHMHAYDDQHWMLAAIEDTYVDGQMRNSDLVYCHPCELDEIEDLAMDLVRRMVDQEVGRVSRAG